MEAVNRKATYRMYPNAEQAVLLDETLALHCRVYNTLLEEHKRRYDVSLPPYSFKLMCQDLTIWRDQAVGLKQLNAQSLQVTAKRVSLAFKAFFRRVKEGAEEPGYPRFKPVSRFSGWGYKTHGDGWRLHQTEQQGQKQPRTHSLRLSGIGNIRLRGKGRFTGSPKTCEIIKKQGKWYLSVTFDVEPKEVSRTPGEDIAAFDWGLTKLLTIAKADGTIETVENPRLLKNKLKALKQLQQTVSLEETKAKALIGLLPDQPIPKGTRLPITTKLKRMYKQVAALHSKVARQRHDFYHKLSTLMVARFGFLASEELDVTLTPHDLRRTAATFMAGMGFMDEIIDAVLNHVKQGIIRTYNRHKYDKEKQLALETWERKLNSIITETKDTKDNVVSINSRKISA